MVERGEEIAVSRDSVPVMRLVTADANCRKYDVSILPA